MQEENEVLEEEEMEPVEPKPQYYADFDEVGNIVGFYVDQIHGDNIPVSAIPIGTENWEVYKDDPNKYKLDGETIREKTQQELDDEAAAQPPAPPSAEERIAQLEQENLMNMLALAELHAQLLTLGGGNGD